MKGLICQEENLIRVENNKTWTTSRVVADTFGKRHDNVLHDIETLRGDVMGLLKNQDTPEFVKTEYRNEQNGQLYPMYLLDRDAFSLLVMGFNNTPGVLEWKLKYIAAFNAMEEKLREASAPPQIDNRMNLARLISRTPANRIDAIKQLYPEYFAPLSIPGTVEYDCDVNSTYQHWLEDCGIDGDWIGSFPTTDIYYNYVRYCNENRAPSMGKKTFYRILADDFNMTARQKSDGHRYFISA